MSRNYAVRIIADSISPEGHRLTTMELEYPRFIHSEFMTHRQFSRNACSSRAIPTAKLIERVRQEPVLPLLWASNKSGMQAGEELGEAERRRAEEWWRTAAMRAANSAEMLLDLGVHKQWANRLLEPFLTIRVVVSATEWVNFFALRCHRDAQPEIRHLADMMAEAIKCSDPVTLNPGEWHLPYVEREDVAAVVAWLTKHVVSPSQSYLNETLIRVSVARCARVSYRMHDGQASDVGKDLDLYHRLIAADPKHASPAEHQATPDEVLVEIDTGGLPVPIWRSSQLHGNFQGWVQYRKTLPGECVKG
jgi:thymidylate synthase ThyX